MKKPVRIMPCLDMRNGRVVKGIRFINIQDVSDPVESAIAYCKQGADEIALLDITATIEGRKILLDVVKNVARVVNIPFTVGGGICDMKIAEEVIEAGADKISVASAAFKNPQLIKELVKHFGSEKITVAIDVDRNIKMPSGYEVYVDGGGRPTGKDAVEWAKEIDSYGVSVILPTSKRTDGAKVGYDLSIIRAIKDAVSAEVVASGGAGNLNDFYEAFEAGATILLAASVFHFGIISIPDLKSYLKAKGVPILERDIATGKDAQE